MDFNYNDDNATDSAAVDTNGDGGGGDSEFQLHNSPTSTDGGRPSAPLETEHQLTNLSMPKKKSSILGASSNLVNSIVGEYMCCIIIDVVQIVHILCTYSTHAPLYNS